MALTLPQIPHASTVGPLPPGLGLILDAIHTTIEVREGRLGDASEKHLTQGEVLALLVRLGVITQEQANAENR